MNKLLQLFHGQSRNDAGVTVEINPYLADQGCIFKAPPLTPQLIQAIKLISPQYDLTPSESSRKFWEVEQNATCWGEFKSLAPLFGRLEKPRRILEIGPGLGRSIVFFSKQLGWRESTIHAYEGEGTSTRYTTLGSRHNDSFCGSIDMLQHILEYNKLNNVTIHNARDIALGQVGANYDLIYSFYSIGFHWSLEYFLDEILSLMSTTSVALFTVPMNYVPHKKIVHIPHRIVEWKTAWPKDGKLGMLIISKKQLPDF